MATHRVLVTCPLIQDSIDEYADQFAANDVEYDVADVDQQLSEAELLDVIDGYHGIIAGDDELTERVLEAADELSVIAKWGIGTDNIDLEAARDRGITVQNTPGAFATEVAAVVLGYAVMLTRKLHLIDRAVRNGEWHCPRGRSLEGKTFGVVGVGNIGSTVARRAAAFDMEVLGVDVEPFPQSLHEDVDIERVDRRALFERADVVSLNCALTTETRDMVDDDALASLGPEGYLINTGRGELVVEEALVEALRDGALAGAALDVFRQEPLPADHPLTEFENVILGSHNAQNTVEAVEAVNDRAVQNLIDGLAE